MLTEALHGQYEWTMQTGTNFSVPVRASGDFHLKLDPLNQYGGIACRRGLTLKGFTG
jgi:hypothetical protein